MKRMIAIVVASIVLAPCGVSARQESDARAKNEPAGVLAGPSVLISPRAKLIERASDGSIVRPETPIEVVVFQMLEPPREAAERVDAIIRSRGRFLESFVAGNIDLLTKFETAGATNDKVDQAMLGLEAVAKLMPLAKGGSLKKQIRAALPREDAAKFDALLKEYWDAIVSQEQSKDPKKSRFEIVAGERVQSVLREIVAAYQRLEKSGSLLFTYFFESIELSKEQEAEIRTLLDEFVDEIGGDATPQQEQRLFFSLLGKLNSGQQLTLIRKVQGRGPAAKPASEKMKEKAKSERSKDGSTAK